MLSYFWITFLYQPVFNALIWIYLNISNQNLGWAVVWLTVGLRLVLLPLTVISERDVIRKQKMEKEAREAAESFKNDPVAQKEAIRKIMRRNKVSPWAKALTVGIQLLVLVLLYQVFLRGITGEKVAKFLYSWINFPGKINTDFYGFYVGAIHDSIWAGVAAGYLFLSILLDHRKKQWAPGEAVFLFLFPAFTFVALWALPMVKSLFILTTMVFSDIIALFRKLLFPVKTTN